MGTGAVRSHMLNPKLTKRYKMLSYRVLTRVCEYADFFTSDSLKQTTHHSTIHIAALYNNRTIDQRLIRFFTSGRLCRKMGV
jgi:hypothetical protein